MIKNDKGEIEVVGVKVPEIMLEWAQLTHAIAVAITEGTGVEMDMEKMVQYGMKTLEEVENKWEYKK